MKKKLFSIADQSGISLIALCAIIFIIVLIVAIVGKNLEDSTYVPSQPIAQGKEERSTYIPKCTNIAYTTLARNAERYIGMNFKFTGQVAEVINKEINAVDLIVNITPQTIWGETSYSEPIYISYEYDENTLNRITKNHIIDIYGKCDGFYNYNQTTYPKINALYIDIK